MISRFSSERKSVSGFSRLEYVFSIAQKMVEKTSFSIQEAHQAVKEAAVSIEAERRTSSRTRIDVSRLGEAGYGATGLEGITRSALSGMTKWRLIRKKSKEEYLCSEELVRLGRTIKDGDFESAKIQLLNSLFAHEDPFRPGRFLLGLRDYVCEKVTFGKPEEPEYKESTWSGNGGIAFTDTRFTDYLNTNSWAISIMSDWGRFFGLSEWFPETFHFDGTKQFCRMLLLTKRMASIEELRQLSQFQRSEPRKSDLELSREFSKTFGLSLYASDCVCFVARKLGLLGMDIDVPKELFNKEVVDRAVAPRGLVISDTENYRGVLTGMPSNPSQTFVLLEEDFDLDHFQRVLYEEYVRATAGKTYESAYIHTVRKNVCTRLRISILRFDSLLTKCYKEIGPPYIELAKSSLGEKIGLGLDLIPFKYLGAAYHLIRVRPR